MISRGNIVVTYLKLEIQCEKMNGLLLLPSDELLINQTDITIKIIELL